MLRYTAEFDCITGYVTLRIIVSIELRVIRMLNDPSAVKEMGRKPLYHFTKTNIKGMLGIMSNYV